jgi:hypothetical protein
MNPVHDEVYSIQHYVIKICQWLAAGQWFSPGTPDSSTNKTDRHDITEILLKLALNPIPLPTTQITNWLTNQMSLIASNDTCTIYILFFFRMVEFTLQRGMWRMSI